MELKALKKLIFTTTKKRIKLYDEMRYNEIFSTFHLKENMLRMSYVSNEIVVSVFSHYEYIIHINVRYTEAFYFWYMSTIT